MVRRILDIHSIGLFAYLLLLLLLLGPCHIQPSTYTNVATYPSINSAIGNTQSSVRVPVEMIHMHTYTGKGV